MIPPCAPRTSASPPRSAAMSDREPRATPHVHPRAVSWRHGLAWYEDAMRFFKLAPLTFAGIAILAIATELALKAAPGGLGLISEILSPLVGSGLVYAIAAVDRRERPTLGLAFAAFRAGGNAIAAVIAASVITTAAQVLAGWWIADVNLLAADASAIELTPSALLGIYAVAIVVSLPVTFVPFHALLEGVSLPAAFALSAAGFSRNVPPLVAYAFGTFVLLGFGLLTFGIGFVVALPLATAASYAAWKDVFGVAVVPAE
jgi:hypothetical protein